MPIREKFDWSKTMIRQFCAPVMITLMVVGCALITHGCGEDEQAHVEGDPVIGGSDAQSGQSDGASSENPGNNGDPVVHGSSVDVDDSHRSCATVEDCVAVYTDCSSCEGACTGVNQDYELQYTAALDCSEYDGPVCDYDCHPRAGLTELKCIEGLCSVEEL